MGARSEFQNKRDNLAETIRADTGARTNLLFHAPPYMTTLTAHSCAVCSELAELTNKNQTDSLVLVLEAADLHHNVRQGCTFCHLVYCAITAFAGNRGIPENGVYIQLGHYCSPNSAGSDGDSGRSLKLETFFADYDGLSLEIFCLQGKYTGMTALKTANYDRLSNHLAIHWACEECYPPFVF